MNQPCKLIASLLRGIPLTAALGLFGLAAMTPASGQIENGDFGDWKSDGMPAQWNVGILPPTAKDEIVLEPINEDGVPGIKFSNHARSAEIHMAQSAKHFLGGAKYRLTFEFKKAGWSPGFGMIVFEPGPGAPNLRVLEAFGKEDEFSETWQKIQAEFQIPVDADVSRWHLQIRLIGQGEFYLRKLEIEDAG